MAEGEELWLPPETETFTEVSVFPLPIGSTETGFCVGHVSFKLQRLRPTLASSCNRYQVHTREFQTCYRFATPAYLSFDHLASDVSSLGSYEIRV